MKTCKVNICPLCKESHGQNHIIINYELKNFICDKHGDNYNLYCDTCRQNICICCENEHENHEIISFGKIIPNKNEINNYLNILKDDISKFKNEVQKIINTLKKLIENFDIYYQISNNIMTNSFNIKRKNYEILYNIKNIKNDDIVNDINRIINEKNITLKFNYMINIYNAIYNLENIKESSNGNGTLNNINGPLTNSPIAPSVVEKDIPQINIKIKIGSSVPKKFLFKGTDTIQKLINSLKIRSKNYSISTEDRDIYDYSKTLNDYKIHENSTIFF